MKLSTVIFGGTEERPLHYQVTDPPATWRRLPGEAAECVQCGQTLTFCFAGRTDESKTGIGTYYMIPTGVRCDCFFDGSQSRTLKRDPVLITPVGPYGVARANEIKGGQPNPTTNPQKKEN